MYDYKKTLNLPKTKFSMRANLTQKEPQILKNWYENNLYQIIRKNKENKKIFFLHDGPPYANGNIHIGHAVNKILKDIIIKSKNLSGFDAPYIPSWDCHGLPIEQKVEEKIGVYKKKINTSNFQEKCRKYAKNQVNKQKKDFIRLGVIGDWENAHLTMDYKNEANIIKTLSKIIKKKHLYRDFKPIHWCLTCESSLSDAEIEYFTKKSDAIFVAMKSNDENLKKIFDIYISNNKETYLPIWTTTPWTLPSSQAITVHPDFKYDLIETKSYNLIIAKELVKNTLTNLKIKSWKCLFSTQGKQLEGIKFLHPFLTNISLPVILGKHVTLEAGTGAVHTSPDHGQDDYNICQKYNINPINLINYKGNFKKNIHPKLDGVNIFKANKIIIKLLIDHHCLLSHESLNHSYPHCWRHKTPIIFRATAQWFINLNKNNFRYHTIKEIKKVSWIPKWGKSRIEEMIKNRPDWCISRQRQWGVPMSIFIHKKTGLIHPESSLIMEKIIKKVELEGIQIWWNINLKEILGQQYNLYDQTFDILDVWFESGNTHTSIQYKNKKNIKNHADMFLEGSDQHRGWFMSSLMISMLTEQKAPYSEVLTHGFVVDGKGQKMSKSIGNTISPNDIINTLGADVLRLWVASSNYTNDISISNEILKRTSDIYRRIRNTARFMLANINDFNPNHNIIPKENMIYLDQWAISHAKIVQKEIIILYNKYNFHGVIQRLMHFCSVEMGSFYLDIIKDRQYTLKKNSLERRSCQTAIYYIIHAFVRWISPILSFTANEIWSYLPGKNSKYVFTEEWFDKLFELNDSILNHEFWNELIEIKNEINKFIEEEIKNKKINNSLEASITLYVKPEIKKKLNILGNELKFIFLTSHVLIKNYDNAPKNIKKSLLFPKFKILLNKSKEKKCPRCWHYNIPITYKNDYDICTRCISNTKGNGEKRMFI